MEVGSTHVWRASTYARVEEDVARLDVAMQNRADGVALPVAVALLEREEDVREDVPDEALLNVGPAQIGRVTSVSGCESPSCQSAPHTPRASCA